ncbi:MAG: hypothetical protein F6K19_51120, partial [Cyanothece sp. SIO1E1]|nr:hypothetical protein [Cyanothece sp. SIO1E1]
RTGPFLEAGVEQSDVRLLEVIGGSWEIHGINPDRKDSRRLMSILERKKSNDPQ